MEESVQQLTEQIGSYMPIVVAALKALVVIVIGWIAAGGISGFIRRRMLRAKNMDPTLAGFVSSLVKWIILLVVLIAVLELFGVEATSLVAILGAATLAIGLALQGTLSDLAAGVMLVLFRPYKVGQFVDVGGTSGTVKNLNLFVTELVTPDNVQIIMPNGKAWGAIITNFSAHSTRRVDLTFNIDYGDDADKAIAIIEETVTADERVHKDPAPWVRVVNLGDSSVDLGVRIWCDAGDYWELKFAMTKQVKEAFDQGGISIPYPHIVRINREA